MNLRLWGRIFILVYLQSFVSNLIINDPFFLTCNEILENRVIYPHWKKFCHHRYAIFHIILTESIRNQDAKLAHFSIFFKWPLIFCLFVGWFVWFTAYHPPRSFNAESDLIRGKQKGFVVLEFISRETFFRESLAASKVYLKGIVLKKKVVCFPRSGTSCGKDQILLKYFW